MAQWQVMGWVNAIAAVLMGFIYPIRLKMQTNRWLIPVYRTARLIHPAVGMAMILVALLHGSMALGQLRLHSGLVIVILLILMALTALAGRQIGVLKNRWRSVHRTLGIVMLVSLAAHLVFPWWL